MLLEIAKSFEADVVLCLGIMFKIFSARAVRGSLVWGWLYDFEHFERH